MTVCDAQGYGRQRGQTQVYRGNEYKTNLLRKIALEIVVNDDFLERTRRDGRLRWPAPDPRAAIGDGKIFVLPADQAIDISGRARGPEAV